MMAAIEVHLAADLKATRRVVLRENGGDYTDIQFSEQFVNLELPPKTFDLNAPADIEKIRSAAANAKPNHDRPAAAKDFVRRAARRAGRWLRDAKSFCGAHGFAR